jgi:DMSO/TMAO reductase YedYZ heme-binding membrane subunit
MAPAVIASTQVWWYVARASGIVAWALAALAVVWGMALSTRALGRRPPAPWLLDLHRFLGGLTVVFVGVHLVGLVLDPFVGFGPLELLVPLASGWKPVAVAWGVVALYLLVAVEVTSLLRSRLPARLWRSVHLTSYAVYALATVHLLTAGTDRHNPVLRAALVASVGTVVFFTVYHLVGPGRAASVKASARPPTTARRAGQSADATVPAVAAPAGQEWRRHGQERDRPVRRRAGDTSGPRPRGRPGVEVRGEAGRGQHQPG